MREVCPCIVAQLELTDYPPYLINNELTAQEIEKYRAEKLIAKSWELNVYASPSKKGQIVGKIIITADPGKGLSAFYQNTGSSNRIRFEPDEFDVDWGYGPPYFHQTALKQIGSWFLLPRNPMPTAGWIDINQISRKTKDSYGNDIPYNILNIESEMAYTFENKSIVIINIDKKGLLVRPEQPADMWCDEGDAPPLKETIPIKLKYSDIYDKDGHLKLHVKYKRGC